MSRLLKMQIHDKLENSQKKTHLKDTYNLGKKKIRKKTCHHLYQKDEKIVI